MNFFNQTIDSIDIPVINQSDSLLFKTIQRLPAMFIDVLYLKKLNSWLPQVIIEKMETTTEEII